MDAGKPLDKKPVEKLPAATPKRNHQQNPPLKPPAVALHPHPTCNWHLECALLTPTNARFDHLFNVPTPTQNVDARKPLDNKLMGKLPAAMLKGNHPHNVDARKPCDKKFIKKHFMPTKRKAECNIKFQGSNSSPVKQSKPSHPFVTPPTHVLCSRVSPSHNTSSKLAPPSQFCSTDNKHSHHSDCDDSSDKAFLINPKKKQNHNLHSQQH